MIYKMLVLGVIALGLGLPGHAGSESSPSQQLVLAYDVYLGGILAAAVDIEIDSDGKYYRIKSNTRSLGMLDLLIGFHRRNEVQGRIVANQSEPTNYTATGAWAGDARSVRIDYSAVDGVRFTTEPSAVRDEREPVSSHLLPGTVDPFSALYQALLHYHESAECGGKIKIFDGRRRYDFLFEAVGGGAIAGPLYSGLAAVCRVRQIPIAGFSRRVWMPRLARPQWVDIWLAKGRKDLPVLPMRLEAGVGLGAMVAHLVAIGGRKFLPGEGPPVH